MLGFDDCGDAGDMSASKGVSIWETEGSKLRDGTWGQALRGHGVLARRPRRLWGMETGRVSRFVCGHLVHRGGVPTLK